MFLDCGQRLTVPSVDNSKIRLKTKKPQNLSGACFPGSVLLALSIVMNVPAVVPDVALVVPRILAVMVQVFFVVMDVTPVRPQVFLVVRNIVFILPDIFPLLGCLGFVAVFHVLVQFAAVIGLCLDCLC